MRDMSTTTTTTCNAGTAHCTTDCLFTSEPCRPAGAPDQAYTFRGDGFVQTVRVANLRAAVAHAVATYPHAVTVAYGLGMAAIRDGRPRRRRVLGVVEIAR